MPLLWVVAGPNGSGKSTFATRVLQPETGLPFINADLIAARTWPGHEEAHGYEAAALAQQQREGLLAQRVSFITETVFSHASKNVLVADALAGGYLVYLDVMMVPVDVTVRRVAERVATGGHTVPEEKIRARYDRLHALIARARDHCDRTRFFDNSSAENAFRLVATYRRGHPIGTPDWPRWAPPVYVGADDSGR